MTDQKKAPSTMLLLQCPFCGGEPSLTHDHYVHDDLRPMPTVECKSCSAWVRLEDWNNRTYLGAPGLGIASAAQPHGDLPARFPEINFSNYGEQEVEALQAWAFEALDQIQATSLTDKQQRQAIELLNLAEHALSHASLDAIGDVIEHTQDRRDHMRVQIIAFLKALDNMLLAAPVEQDDESAACAKSQVEPAAQRQGGHPEGHRERFQKWVIATKHPVFGFLDGRSLARSDDREGYADEYVQGLWVAFKEFAEQPEPVLVALPEREMYTHYLSGVIPSNAVEVNSYKDGWNACLDAATRLNPQRPEQVQAADESSELDKAWGAKNGLECWGHEPTAKGLFEDGWHARAKLSGVQS